MPFPIKTATNTSVTVGSSSTKVLDANSGRLLAILTNDSDTTIYLSLGVTAVLNKGIVLNPNGGSYEINQSNLYVGQVSAIASVDDNNLTVTYSNT
jgi:hypothetical protein